MELLINKTDINLKLITQIMLLLQHFCTCIYSWIYFTHDSDWGVGEGWMA